MLWTVNTDLIDYHEHPSFSEVNVFIRKVAQVLVDFIHQLCVFLKYWYNKIMSGNKSYLCSCYFNIFFCLIITALILIFLVFFD